jgi:hypothetical protein
MKQPLQSNQAILPVRNQELVAFLNYELKNKPNHPVKLIRTVFLGKFITSLREYSDVPIKQKIPLGWIPIVVEFPNTELSTVSRHFNYFSLEHVEEIDDHLQGRYDLFFKMYFADDENIVKFMNEEMEEIEFSKMILIKSFLVGLNLIDFGDSDATIKKREYRMKLQEINRKIERMRKRWYRYKKNIFETKENWLQLVEN